MSVQRCRRRHLEVEAVQWTGDNEEEMIAFAGPNFSYLTEHRDEAVANGIPEALVDAMIQDAENVS